MSFHAARINVSIHASAWEATRRLSSSPPLALFRSTPPRGRRPPRGWRKRLTEGFRSTPPRGRRRAHQCACGADQQFRSTPPRGRRRAVPSRTLARKAFRSTPPRGRRRGRRRDSDRGHGFDPRLRVGGDGSAPTVRLRWRWFRSTPPRGRRRLGIGLDLVSGRFRSTPPRGRRRYCHLSCWAARRFDPRLRVGGDMAPISARWRCGRFDPRLRVGGDPVRRTGRPE